MKPRILSLILTFALLLSAFAGCSTETEPSAGSSGQSPENSDTPAETDPDYSWFSMPEDTGKLEIYSPGNMYSSILDPAVEIFKQLYPDIEVSYQTLSDEEFETRIRTEIPAGRGPDLVLMTDYTFPDIYKTMSTDLFEDLNPWFGTDDEIALSDFVIPVMNGGVLNGKRYLAPLAYSASILMTTQSILDEIGLTADEIATIDGFCEGAARFKEKYPDATLFFDLGGVNPTSGDISTLYRSFGFNLINYETNEVEIDETRFRQYIDLVKLYYDPDYDTADESMWDLPNYSVGGGLHLRRFPYDDQCAESYWKYSNSKTFMPADGEEPVLFLPKNQRGGVTAGMTFGAAIPKGAANKAAAWKLLKILLSDEIQAGHDESRRGTSYFWSGDPVRLSALKQEIPEGDEFFELMQSPTEVFMTPQIYTNKFIRDNIVPYIRGEASWDDCYKKFLNALELYKDE